MKIKHEGTGIGERRRAAYPPLADFADAFVHEANGDPAPMRAYVAACVAVKTRFPKSSKPAKGK